MLCSHRPLSRQALSQYPATHCKNVSACATALMLPAPAKGVAKHLLLSSAHKIMTHDQRQRVQVASLERMQCRIPTDCRGCNACAGQDCSH